MKFIKVKCRDCDLRFVGDSTRHHINPCPGCEKSAVDMEEEYIRLCGSVEVIDLFILPSLEGMSDEDINFLWADLLFWLNRSDEVYDVDVVNGQAQVLRL